MKRTSQIDWNLCIKLAGNNAKIAKKILEAYIDSLKKLVPTIKRVLQEKDYDTLQVEIHKLYGASCICGVPQIKALTAQIESNLIQKDTKKTEPLINKLLKKIDIALQESTALLTTS